MDDLQSQRGAGRESRLVAVTALIYSLALAIESVILPLLALASGYSKAAIGVLTALSAITQLASRLGSAPAMRRFSDRYLVGFATIAMALSAAMVALSAAPVVFVGAELVQGIARGVFWTGSQTHVVRQPGSSVKAMATVNFISSFGLFLGPLLGGLLAKVSLDAALWAAGLASVCAFPLSMLLSKEEPFAQRPRGSRDGIAKSPGVRIGALSGVTAGAWRGILNSYIPVIVRSLGESYFLVGVVVTIANGASILGAGVVGQLRDRSPAQIFGFGVLFSSLGMAAVGLEVGGIWGAAGLLAVSGLGAGALQVLGPALAANGVSRDRKGDAVAVAGSFRAGALLVSPLVVAGVIGPFGLPAAIVSVGVVLGLPLLALRDPTSRARINRAAE